MITDMTSALSSTLALALHLALFACSKEGVNARATHAPSGLPAIELDSIAPESVSVEVSADVGTAVSSQHVDYTRAKASAAAETDTGPTPLERDLLRKLRAVNPAVSATQIVSVRHIRTLEGGAQFIVLANGTTADNITGAGQFTNFSHAEDIYGVFFTNRAFTRATRRIGLFISPRTRDYFAWLVPVRPDSAIVCGHGAMYGDSRARFAFVIDTAAAGRARASDSVTQAVREGRIPAAPEDPEREEYEIPPRPDCPWVTKN
jgi:hypothetical protein